MTRQIVVKISSPDSFTSQHLGLFLSATADTFQDIRFVINEKCEWADFWFVFDEPQAWDLGARVPASRVALALGETCLADDVYLRSPGKRRYLSQFANVYSSQPLDTDNARYTFPLLPWMINSNHGTPPGPREGRDFDWLTSLPVPPKPRELSVFCSHKSDWPGHALRLRFTEMLQEALGERLHWFGNGVRPLESKWDGLVDFKYSIAMENQSARNVITEKIFDPLLAYCVPIYWGAPNIGDYLPPESFEEIDIRSPAGAVEHVLRVLEEDRWEARVPALVQARRAVLTELNMFERLIRLCREDVSERGFLSVSEVRLEIPSDTRARALLRRGIDKLARVSSTQLRRLS